MRQLVAPRLQRDSHGFVLSALQHVERVSQQGSFLEHAANCIVEITAQNVLAQAATDVRFKALEAEEHADPSVPVLDNGYPVYRSRGEPETMLELTGQSILTDFGSSRIGNTPNRGWWMADTYRAPEVLMGLSWSYEVDIWSIGILVSHVLTRCLIQLWPVLAYTDP